MDFQSMEANEIIIIGAGACGLMAARELSKKGNNVTILEGRERAGGRIWSIENNNFGYVEEAGAEFIHGDLPITKSLIKEAGLTLTLSEGEFWNMREGKLTKNNEFIPEWNLVIKKLNEVKEDLPIAWFLEQNFPKEKYPRLHNSIIGFIQGFDAADPEQASTFALREEWTTENNAPQYRIKEGYGALIRFLENECLKNNTRIEFNAEVQSINFDNKKIHVTCIDKKEYLPSIVILTVPLPVLKNISFSPAIPEKIKAASEIGFGTVIKFLFQFKDRWWTKLPEQDLSKAGFIFSNTTVPTWWTQYPYEYPFLTGWLAGPEAEKLSMNSSEYLLDLALQSLAEIFKTEKKKIKEELSNAQLFNWKTDCFAQGAYAYATVQSHQAKEVLLKPAYSNKLFFSGEALYEGKEIGTVEAALASGLKTAEIINLKS